MAEKTVEIRFSEREGSDAVNSKGETLFATLEIDRDKTVGDEPYSLILNTVTGKRIGQDVWLNYYTNSEDPIIVKSTNGAVRVVAENVPEDDEIEEILIFENETEKTLQNVPASSSAEWIGKTLDGSDDAGLCGKPDSSEAPNVIIEGRNIKLSKPTTGVLKVTYELTRTQIVSNAAEAGTVLVAVCQGDLVSTATYECEQSIPGANPDCECCRDLSDQDTLEILYETYDIDPDDSIVVGISGGCPPFEWSIDGVGLSLAYTETEVSRVNSLVADGSACGDGTLTVKDACGSSVQALIDISSGCCGEEEMEWAEGTITSMCINDYSIGKPLQIDGGVGPYEWSIEKGTDVSLRDSQTENGLNMIYSGPSAGGDVRIRVKDSCNDLLFLDIQVGMTWSDDNPEMILQGDPGDPNEVAISVDGGVGPYQWSVSGTGFSLAVAETEEGVNLLYADHTACGSAEVQVTDSCGETVTGYVRCNIGGWVLKETQDACAFGDTLNTGTTAGCPVSDYNITVGNMRWKLYRYGYIKTCMHRDDFVFPFSMGWIETDLLGQCDAPGANQCDWPTPPCGDPHECWQEWYGAEGDCEWQGHSGYCAFHRADVKRWEC